MKSVEIELEELRIHEKDRLEFVKKKIKTLEEDLERLEIERDNIEKIYDEKLSFEDKCRILNRNNVNLLHRKRWKGICKNEISLEELLDNGWKEMIKIPFNKGVQRHEFENMYHKKGKYCVGAMKKDEEKLILCAFGTPEIFQETDSKSQAYEVDNVYWYNFVDYSFGFSPNSEISLYRADTIEDSSRMSWHNYKEGYRIGTLKNLTSSDYFKIILYFPYY